MSVVFASFLPLLLTTGLAQQSPVPASRPSPVWSIAFSPDGRRLAVGAYKQAQIWDVATRTQVGALKGCLGPVRSVSWSLDGGKLAVGGGKPGQQGEVRIWTGASSSPPTGAREVGGTAGGPLTSHTDVVESVALNPAGDTVFSASDDEKALVVAAATGKAIATLGDHTNRLSAIAASPDGKLIATGSLDRTVKIWSAADYRPLANIEFGGGQVLALTFLPTGNLLAVTGEDGSVRIYRLVETRSGRATGIGSSLARTFGGNRIPVLAIAATRSPSGQGSNLLAYGGTEKIVYVVDAANGARRQTLKECTDVIYSVALSPDGAAVAAGCRDGRVLIWNVSDGKLAWEFAPSL